jgi:hypothetical protein
MTGAAAWPVVRDGHAFVERRSCRDLTFAPAFKRAGDNAPDRAGERPIVRLRNALELDSQPNGKSDRNTPRIFHLCLACPGASVLTATCGTVHALATHSHASQENLSRLNRRQSGWGCQPGNSWRKSNKCHCFRSEMAPFLEQSAADLMEKAGGDICGRWMSRPRRRNFPPAVIASAVRGGRCQSTVARRRPRRVCCRRHRCV